MVTPSCPVAVFICFQWSFIIFQVSFFVNLWFVPWRPSFKWSIVTHRIYIIFVDIKQTKVIAPSSRKQPIDLCTLCFIFLTCSTCWRMAFPFLWIKEVIAFLRNFLTKKIIRKQHPIEQINIKTNRHQSECLSNRLCPAIVGILTGPVSLVLLLFLLAIFFEMKISSTAPNFQEDGQSPSSGKMKIACQESPHFITGEYCSASVGYELTGTSLMYTYLLSF